MNEWISVKERIPPDDKDFVIANFRDKPSWMAVAWFDRIHKQYRYTGGDSFFLGHQTHWMLLPDPPAISAMPSVRLPERLYLSCRR